METRDILIKLWQCNKSDANVLEDIFSAIRIYDNENTGEAHVWNKKLRIILGQESKRQLSGRIMEIYKRSLLFDAPYNLDCAIRYAEWDREPNRKFYMPRRKQLKVVVDGLQELEDRKIELLGVMAPPGVGKTTLGIMYLVWTGLKNPELSVLGASHSNSLLRGVYEEINRMLDPKGEYLWHEIFPDSKVVKTNALDMRIDVKNRKRFETFEFSSIGSGNAGKVRASNLLYADDLVPDLESALSRERMDKLWQQYYTDLRQRMIGNAAQLLIQTPWSVHDVISRLEMENAENEKAKFIHLPALDENDESNFDYPCESNFTTEFYHAQREIMDDASWRALYMTEPIEREGQLYTIEQLQRYFDLPGTKVDSEGQVISYKEPDGIFAVCDTKDRGTDYLVMPILYKYGNNYYIEEIICSNGDERMLEEVTASALVRHKVQMCQFESNAAGGKIADIVQEKVRKMGGITSITKKWPRQYLYPRILKTLQIESRHCHCIYYVIMFILSR